MNDLLSARLLRLCHTLVPFPHMKTWRNSFDGWALGFFWRHKDGLTSFCDARNTSLCSSSRNAWLALPPVGSSVQCTSTWKSCICSSTRDFTAVGWCNVRPDNRLACNPQQHFIHNGNGCYYVLTAGKHMMSLYKWVKPDLEVLFLHLVTAELCVCVRARACMHVPACARVLRYSCTTYRLPKWKHLAGPHN